MSAGSSSTIDLPFDQLPLDLVGPFDAFGNTAQRLRDRAERRSDCLMARSSPSSGRGALLGLLPVRIGGASPMRSVEDDLARHHRRLPRPA